MKINLKARNENLNVVSNCCSFQEFFLQGLGLVSDTWRNLLTCQNNQSTLPFNQQKLFLPYQPFAHLYIMTYDRQLWRIRLELLQGTFCTLPKGTLELLTVMLYKPPNGYPSHPVCCHLFSKDLIYIYFIL